MGDIRKAEELSTIQIKPQCNEGIQEGWIQVELTRKCGCRYHITRDTSGSVGMAKAGEVM